MIVWSNGWDNDTVALQLFSYLEEDALNVAHLVPLPRRQSRSGLLDALTAHYGSPGRLEDYRRQFERTIRTVGEDPVIFATALETLDVEAFGDMGQTARLRLCANTWTVYHQRLQSGMWLTDAAFVRATPTRQFAGLDPIHPAYVVGDADNNSETTRVAAITGQKSSSNQLG